MNEIINTLTIFFNIFREDIREYYQKSHSYLKDLIAYKKIDLTRKIENESEKEIKINLEKMLKAIKTGLNTIGVSIDELNQYQNSFLATLSKNKASIVDYNSYFKMYLNKYVNKLLIEILFEYLLDIDAKKLENVNLFDLLPPYFISRLNEFKKSHFSTGNIPEIFKQENYKDYINFTELTVIKPKEKLETDILSQLKAAKEGSIEKLKIPKKEFLEETITTPQVDHDFNIKLNTGTFIDYFGHFDPIQPSIIDKFEIDRLSLINSKVVNRDYFDLENLFYYLSILKMLNLEFPFSNTEIIEIIKDFINGWVFSSSKDNIPDVISNFYGLVIYSELDLINQTNLIDLQEIENYIRSELANFVPEKLELNLHSLLCLRMISTIQKKALRKKLNLASIFDLNLLEMENFKPTLDIYHHLVTLKLLDKDVNINNLKNAYANEIKKLIIKNGTINDLVTESSRALLIFDLLGLKKQEAELCSNLLNFILNKTSFFSIENVDKDFNWRSDKYGFKIELEMLYWALLASSQFAPTNY